MNVPSVADEPNRDALLMVGEWVWNALREEPEVELTVDGSIDPRTGKAFPAPHVFSPRIIRNTATAFTVHWMFWSSLAAGATRQLVLRQLAHDMDGDTPSPLCRNIRVRVVTAPPYQL